jgi:serine/threonine protein kinase
VGRHIVLAGRYELMSPLGRGGMGQVWEGRDQRLERSVAVKLLTDEVLAGRAEREELVRRFAREAAVTAGLQHPGVPAVYDAGTYDGGLFLVMELVGGCTLGDLVAEQGSLPVPWATAIAAQVAAVLAAAHERRLVHRDVKPQNVMVLRDGTVKVLDFGVAALLDASMPRLTKSGESIGTPAYMAPEQLHSLPATPRTDLYALGCVLYELLAGGPVFSAPSPAGLMRMHLEQAPAPLQRPDLHPDLEMLVRQLLEKDPARRPADAREVYDRLLAHVVRPGPLGDVDATGARSGMHSYSRVLVRLSGAVPSVSYAPTAPPVMRRSAGQRIVHSLWMVPILFFGLGTWLSFGYIAARYRRLSWLIAAVVYLGLTVTAFLLLGSGPASDVDSLETNLGMAIALLSWAAGLLHALWVKDAVRRVSPSSWSRPRTRG